MILRNLAIHNIASIADAEIDFTNGVLGEASIFLITGETGAGKSTILDSICLALYDRTPRMASTPREEIGERTDNNNERYYSNDNSQLLRRGTGEGYVKLQFIGSDSTEYEATWTIQRNYRKPDRKLQKPTRSLVSLDGTYAETSKKIISDKIIEITGLDYDQFCRTVMLAQGEFTKFLKSDRNGKSEILEKLTGTGIYSEIGIRIAETYLNLKNKYENLSHSLRNFDLLTESEIAERKNRIDAIISENTAIAKDLEIISAKLKWIDDKAQLDTRAVNCEKAIALSTATLNSEKLKRDLELVERFNMSAEVRVLIKERKKCNNLIEIKEKLYPTLENNRKRAEDDIARENRIIENIRNDLSELESTLKKYDLPTINRMLNTLNEKTAALNELSNVVDTLAKSQEVLDALKGNLHEKTEIIRNNEIELEKLNIPIIVARKSLETISAELEKLELAGTKAAKALRATLKEGERCPVCGEKVTGKFNEDVIYSLIKPLRESKKKSENDLNALVAREIAADKLREITEKEVKELTVRIKRHETSIKKEENTLVLLLAKCGYEGVYNENLYKMIEEEKLKIGDEAGQLRKKQSLIENLLSAQSSLLKKLECEQARLQQFKDEHVRIEKALTELHTEIITITGRREELNNAIKDFFTANPGMNEGEVLTLDSVPDSYIKEIVRRRDALSHQLAKEKGALDNIKAQIDEIEKTKPEYKETETKEYLEEEGKRKEKRYNSLNVESGKIREQLDNNKRNLESYHKWIVETELARTEKERWEGLYYLLGDNEGNKFRNIAQSYILQSLLDNANYYMQSFTDRYTLTCNPGSLAILVKDTFRPGNPQTASILSGGESFMASLSLALALSNLKSKGNDVDILFIDEGFGTLSPEYLGNVMDTLEKLYQIGGRKVGLISHIEDMKERIPVQIQVKRESPSLSTIHIV